VSPRPLALLGAAALALTLSACGADDPAPPQAGAGAGVGAPAIVEAPAPAAASVPASGSELDAGAFAAALQAPHTVILDVRTPAEFAAGHLPGAVNIDVESPDFGVELAELDPDVPYAVYCRSGNRSGVALDLMAAAGFTHNYHLGGGIGAWAQAGGPIVAGD